MKFRNIFTASAVFLLTILIQCCGEVDPLEDVTSVTDYDNNSYKVIRIGNQLWMEENLKTTHFNDGAIIPLVTDNPEWINNHSPGLCYYNNDESTYKDTYGPLYNWYSVETGRLCPSGWHVPSDQEWALLSNYVGNKGGMLKETGTNHWQSPNNSITQVALLLFPEVIVKCIMGHFQILALLVTGHPAV